MAAQSQCDRPHVRFESRRNSPATASESYPEVVSSMGSSDIIMEIISTHPSALQSPLTAMPSLLVVHPSPIPSSSRPRPDAPPEDLDRIEMPSAMLTFGAHSGVVPDTINSSVHSYEELLHITTLERQVCSNYVCCGSHLIDFHALINHFEEKHISIVTPNGKRIYPPEVLKPKTSRISSPASTLASTMTTPASSRSSSVFSSAPATPLTPMNMILDTIVPSIRPGVEYNPYTEIAPLVGSSSDLGQRHPYSSDTISAFGPEYDFLKDYACYEHYYAEKIRRLREQEQKEREERDRELRRIEEEAYAAAHGIPSPTVQDEVPEDVSTLSSSTLGNSPLAPSQKAAASSSKKKSSKARKDCETPGVESSISNNGGKVAKSKGKMAGTSSNAGLQFSSSGRKREKVHRCPRDGCSKAYLNPNGLKYHLEKGTCTFDDPETGAAEILDGSMGSSTEPTPSSSSMGTPVAEPSSNLPAVPASTTTNVSASTSFKSHYPTKPMIAPPLNSSHSPAPNPTTPGFYSEALNPMTPQEICQSVLRTSVQGKPQLLTHLSPQVPSLSCDATSGPGSNWRSSVPDAGRSQTGGDSSPYIPIFAPAARLSALSYPYALGRSQVVCEGSRPPSSSL